MPLIFIVAYLRRRASRPGWPIRGCCSSGRRWRCRNCHRRRCGWSMYCYAEHRGCRPSWGCGWLPRSHRKCGCLAWPSTAAGSHHRPAADVPPIASVPMTAVTRASHLARSRRTDRPWPCPN